MNNDKDVIENDSLDNLERVKTLSPSMMVVKRFFRNKLAIVGLVILVFMLLLSVVGPLFSPYGETQVFHKKDIMKKEYAGAAINDSMNVIVKEGLDYNPQDLSMAVLEYQIDSSVYPTVNDKTIFVIPNSNGSYSLSETEKVGKASGDRLVSTSDVKVDDKMLKAYKKAKKNNVNYFEAGVKKYAVIGKDLVRLNDIGIASYLIFNVYNEADIDIPYDFRNAAELMICKNATSFVAGGQEYAIEYQGDTENPIVVFYKVEGSNKTEYAMASKYAINAITKEFLDMNFKTDLIDALKNSSEKFTSKTIDGKETTFYIKNVNGQYSVRRLKEVEVYDTKAAPSSKHILGTDTMGMDLMTRLMYGGRISLLVGFIVVALELIIGVILGGIAGYFGRWVDTLIMRMVEVFNCIPTMPLFIIIGTFMDTIKFPAKWRILVLALLLAAFYWTSIARMVRGQILSLREQEFMVATEAMGIRTSKRIFKHLIPNVMPMLIVMATMDLGGVILTEATLSFFGLGIKFPYASWGGIVNAVNDMQVMKTCWWIWIPAGVCILLTVLGFNFVGDGLRDAFDPKMKR